ncbi:hypothetical protein AB7M17_000197 [Bradyrhizobium sp. USDA 377]
MRGVRGRARRLDVTLASLCHLVWGRWWRAAAAVSRWCSHGAVRPHAWRRRCRRTMGLFINIMPLRLDLDRTAVEASLHIRHARLPELVAHEHASLALGVLQSSSHLISAEAQRTLTTSPNVVRTGKGGARSRMSAGFAYGREPPRPEESLTRFAHSSEFSNPCRTSGGDSCILFGRRTKNDRTPRISKRRRQSIVSAGLNPELRESMGT